MMKAKKIKDMKFKYDYITICYGRNGHRLYQGYICDIPEHLMEYWCGYQIINKSLKRHYVEVTEDEKFWQ